MEILMLKSPSGSLVPMGEDQVEQLKRLKSGAVIKCNISVMRNGPFFRKWWSLVKMAFDLASERMTPRQHKGVDVLPCFEEFRKDITILAGYYDATYRYDGTLKLRAKSLRWDKMTDDEFERLYSATIDAILQKVLPGLDPRELQNAVDMTLSYA